MSSIEGISAGTVKRLSGVITSMRHAYAADQCLTIEQQSPEIIEVLLIALLASGEVVLRKDSCLDGCKNKRAVDEFYGEEK